MNILIISDLHIDNYTLYNPTNKFRLHQYRDLAKRILEESEINKAKNLFILGDIINKSVTDPLVLHELKKFIQTIIDFGITIYFILGQHDVDSKELEFDYSDTYITLFENEKFIYAHNKIFEFEGNTIYFKNWTNTDYVDIEANVDVFCSHLSMNYGQYVNSDKFKIGLFGDIHDAIELGNCYSIGTPFQLKSNEPQTGFIGLLTLSENENPKFKRIPSDNDHFNFLKFGNTSKEEDTIEEVHVSSNPNSGFNLEEYLKNKNLIHIHEKINKTNIPELIDFNFKLNSIKIQNFKSIDDLTLNVQQLGKLSLISGHNGSGKSVILNAIYVGLLGFRNMTYFESNKGGELKISIELSHGGSLYKIIRMVGYTEFYINGEKQKKNNKPSLDKYIYECLPFLNYLDMFFIWTGEHFFEKVDRTQLLKTCFNLHYLDYFYYQGLELKDREESRFNDLKNQKEKLYGTYLGYKKILESEELKNKDYVLNDTEDNLRSQLSYFESLLKSNLILNESIATLTKLKQNLLDTLKETDDLDIDGFDTNYELSKKAHRLKKEIRFIEERVAVLKNRISINLIKCPNCNHEFSTLDRISHDKLSLELNSAKNELIRLNQELNLIDINNIKTKQEYDKIKTKIDQRIAILDQLGKLDKELISKEKQFNIKYKEFQDLVNLEDPNLWKERKQFELSQHLKKQETEKRIEEYKLLINKIIDEANELKVQIETQTNLIKNIFEYTELFNIKNLDSYTYKLIDYVIKNLNSDNVKFSTSFETVSGTEKLYVSCSILVKGIWVDYDSASSGQQTYLDLFILNRLSKVIKNIGFLGLDESLTNLDKENYELAREMMYELNIKNIILISHSSKFTGENNRINLYLDDKGYTRIKSMESR